MLRNLEMGAVPWPRKVATFSAQTKRFERFVRACVDSNSRVLGLCLWLFVSSTPAWSQRSDARVGLGNVSTSTQVRKESKDQLWKGTYVNYEYGYSLTIPRGLVGLGPPAPWPQHGIEIRLAGNHHAHILTNADFSAIDYPSLDAAVDSDLQAPRKNSTETQLVSRRSARLRSLEAMRVMVRYKEAVSGMTFVGETITAIRRAKHPEEGVLYTIKLVAPEQRYENDRKVFERILLPGVSGRCRNSGLTEPLSGQGFTPFLCANCVPTHSASPY